ncbi:MAG: hypothetical protein HC921_14635 [Synechococcaceae cyanobacterium SM2_3_1]|nr:hypothetical protein [Synechococcaceae cyanobacterium SM2_3_1]
MSLSQEPSPDPSPSFDWDPATLSAWLTAQLPAGVNLWAKEKETQLVLLVETDLDPDALVEDLCKSLRTLTDQPWQHLQVFGRAPGEEIPDWYRSAAIAVRSDLVQPSLDPPAPQAGPGWIELAQQGDPQALTHIFAYLLREDHVTVRIHLNRKAGLLQMNLQADPVPDQKRMSALVFKTLDHLQLPYARRLWLTGQKKSSLFPAWSQELSLAGGSWLWPHLNAPTKSPGGEHPGEGDPSQPF